MTINVLGKYKQALDRMATQIEWTRYQTGGRTRDSLDLVRALPLRYPAGKWRNYQLQQGTHETYPRVLCGY
jgi:hypothetical protein